MVYPCFSSASAISPRRHRTEQLIVFAGLCAIVTVTPAISLARSPRFGRLSLASRRRCAWRSCSTIFLFESVAATASRLGNRKLRA